mgnify:FL=1
MVAHDPGGLLSPPHVLGPWMVQWLVEPGDDGAQTVTYRQVLCTGTAALEATGTLEGTGAERTITWTDNGEGEAIDPWVGDAKNHTTDAKVTSTTFVASFEEKATTDVAGQKDKFKKSCIAAGEDIAAYFK